jgi:ABC-type methionine transport system permease subunit
MMTKLSSETLRSIEKGAINAAKNEGATSVTITARMTSEATDQILSKNGFTQVVDQAGHKTSEFIKTIPFENK